MWPTTTKKTFNKDELARSIGLTDELDKSSGTDMRGVGKLYLEKKAEVMDYVAAKIAQQMAEIDLTDTSIEKLAKALDIMNKSYRLETNQSTQIKETIATTLHRILCETEEKPLIAEPMETAEIL